MVDKEGETMWVQRQSTIIQWRIIHEWNSITRFFSFHCSCHLHTLGAFEMKIHSTVCILNFVAFTAELFVVYQFDIFVSHIRW